MAPATYKVTLTVGRDIMVEVTASSTRSALEIALHEYVAHGERNFWSTSPEVVDSKVTELEAGQ